MLICNYSFINQICGHVHSGLTNPCQFIRPHSMRGYYGRAQSDPNIERINRDTFPTGTNSPYSLILGDKGGLLSATTTIFGTSSTSISMAMGLAAQSELSGSGDMSGGMSLIIQLACQIIGSSNISASISGKLEMASSLAGSGDIVASLNLIAFIVSEIMSSGTVDATFKGNSSLSADISSTSTLSPESLAAAVWNTIASAFNTPGTMGNKMNSAASSGDPWTAALPGSYLDTQAGGILAQIQTLVDELHQIEGLKSGSPMTVTPISRSVGNISLEITGDGETLTQVERV